MVVEGDLLNWHQARAMHLSARHPLKTRGYLQFWQNAAFTLQQVLPWPDVMFFTFIFQRKVQLVTYKRLLFVQKEKKILVDCSLTHYILCNQSCNTIRRLRIKTLHSAFQISWVLCCSRFSVHSLFYLVFPSQQLL